MNGQQKIVFWLGFILIVARFFGTGQFKAVWSTVTSGGSSGGKNGLTGIPAQPQQGPTQSAPGGSGTIHIPGIGNVPFPYMNYGSNSAEYLTQRQTGGATVSQGAT